MTDKKVSIILPVYNGEALVSESINSIIRQTYQNWELIIVNDCSTDKTLQVCEDIAKSDQRIKVFSNDRNLKLPGTLNAGFSHATGDYYTWTSDDNMYRPYAIEKMVSVLEGNTNAVMVYANYTNIDAASNEIGPVGLQEPEFIVTGNVCGACFLYTSEAAAKVGEYDTGLFLAEDYDYWLRMYLFGKLIHLKEDLYLYRRHGQSLTETRKSSVNEQTYKALEKNFEGLYPASKASGLTDAFFDQMLVRGEAHYRETLRMLLKVNGKYRYHLLKQKIYKVKERLFH